MNGVKLYWILIFILIWILLAILYFQFFQYWEPGTGAWPYR